MGADRRTVFRCAECGADHPKWGGKCDACGAWNTLVEEVVAKKRGGPPAPSVVPVRLSDVMIDRTPRVTTGLDEFDFVLGGGLVPGSVVLVGGEPGIGKSTLLLQVAARLAAGGAPILYAAGEESAEQVRLRAERLADDAGAVLVVPEVRVDAIVAHAAAACAQAVIVDSIQTAYTDDLEGAPGNVGQVRECAARLVRYAKASNAAVLLIGHVTRGGVLAGPKTLEHVVDTVVYFEGASAHDFRILRAVKNRFGSIDEVGVFAMTAHGLHPLGNPSAAFLAGRERGIPGSAVTALMEGSRPVLLEIQALAAKAGFGTPQRVATGLDHKRLAVLLAVLERRASLPFHDQDVFVNVTGGVRLVEPATDLAVVAALVSSVTDRPLPADALFLGEVGLGGEVRPVPAIERRLAEAQRLGFRQVFTPARSAPVTEMDVIPVAHVADVGRRLAA